uniref:Uncharacterized protein n=1 Tax=Rhizophora mucronata TaxID=61149 RepID=A0A2P2IWA9_RHIMU
MRNILLLDNKKDLNTIISINL